MIPQRNSTLEIRYSDFLLPTSHSDSSISSAGLSASRSLEPRIRNAMAYPWYRFQHSAVQLAASHSQRYRDDPSIYIDGFRRSGCTRIQGTFSPLPKRARLSLLIGVEQNYSVVLIIPDFYERAFVREFVHLLLVTMGFKQVCAQQVRPLYFLLNTRRCQPKSIAGIFSGHLRRWYIECLRR